MMTSFKELVEQHPYWVLFWTFTFYIVAMLMNVTQNMWLWPAIEKINNRFNPQSEVIYYSTETDADTSVIKKKRRMDFIIGTNPSEKKFRTGGAINARGYWQPVDPQGHVHEFYGK